MFRALFPGLLLSALLAFPAQAQKDLPDFAPATDFSAQLGKPGGGKAGGGGGGGGGKANRGGGGGGGKADRGGRGGGGGKIGRGGGGDRPKAFRGGGDGGRKAGRGDGGRRGGEARRDRGPRIERSQRREQVREQRRERKQDRAQRRERNQDRVQRSERNRDQLRELQSRQREQLKDRNLSREERRTLRAQQQQERRDLRERQRGEGRKDAQDREHRRNQLTEEQRERREAARKARAERREQRLRERNEKREQRADRRERRRIGDDEARRNRFVNRDIGERRRRGDFSRRAWRDGRRANFVAWVGPLFLPYIYADLFDYTFFPYAYDRGYWGYVYDDFFDSMFWAYGSPYADPGFAAPLPRGPARARSAPQARRAVAQLCEPARGLTAWPFDRIARAVNPNEEQQKLLDQVRDAAGEAADAFKASCRTDFALTPPGRVSAMISRIESTLEALRIVRPPLEAFYTSLTDEQKERFNQIGPDIGRDTAAAARKSGAPEQDPQACKDAKTGLANAPIDRIEDVVQPTEAQRASFQKLADASQSAVEILQAACPQAVALTPTGRLETMQTRLEAMLDAAETVQPALEEFYASLSNEQKARFNSLGREAQRVN